MVKLIGDPRSPVISDPIKQYAVIIEQGIRGDKGDKGDSGTPGAPGTAGAPGGTFEWHQVPLASVWTVIHNLGRPAEPVLLLDDDPETPVWSDWVVTDLNTTTIILPVPATGWAYF